MQADVWRGFKLWRHRQMKNEMPNEDEVLDVTIAESPSTRPARDVRD